MEPRREAMNSTSPQLVNQDGESPLRRYLAALGQGDEGRQLLHHIRLYVYRAKLEGEQSTREIALEVMQEVVVEALRSEANFDAARSPMPWLLGIAVNLIKRRREKLFRRRRHETSVVDLAAAGGVTEEQLFDRLAAHAKPGPEEGVLAAIDVADLMAHLAPAERRLIECYLLNDMNSVEVGQELGITPGNARVRFHRLLIKLRTLWPVQTADRPQSAHPNDDGREKQSHE